MVERTAGATMIDITRPVVRGIPVWPGDHDFDLDQRRDEGFVLSSFSTTCHVGSHVDAPLHLDAEAGGVETVPVERCLGPVELIQVDVGVAAVHREHLPDGWRPSTARILVRTDSHPLRAAFEAGFTGLSAELLHWWADCGVELVGIDTPSVDLFSSEALPAHHALLERGMTWIEGLWAIIPGL